MLLVVLIVTGVIAIKEVVMQYIKAKFESSKRSYTYRTEDDVKPGDIARTIKAVNWQLWTNL